MPTESITVSHILAILRDRLACNDIHRVYRHVLSPADYPLAVVRVIAPVKRFDIPALLDDSEPRTLVLVDSLFHSVPAVGHIEIRDAIEAGLTVMGVVIDGGDPRRRDAGAGYARTTAAITPATTPPAHEDRREIDSWVCDYLQAEGNANTRDVIHDGKLAGFSEDQIKKARRRVGATSIRQGFGKGSTVIWAIGATDAIDDGHTDKAPMAPMASIAAPTTDQLRCQRCSTVLTAAASIELGICEECRLSDYSKHGGVDE
jgi:hypothetical protein